ncbi:MAG: hypothetical protein R2712_14585 [Vicinamibacterales bacterium]
MGRLAEAEGEGEIWRDLRMKPFIDLADLQRQYAVESPAWLKGLGWTPRRRPQLLPADAPRRTPRSRG